MNTNGELFDRLVECYRKYLGGNLVSIVLFGSRARGDAKPESDYDLLIVADNLPENPLARSRFIRKPVVGKFEERIAIVAKTRDEIMNDFPPLFLDIGLDGKLLYDGDGFFEDRLRRIRDIIESAGLRGCSKETNTTGSGKVILRGGGPSTGRDIMNFRNDAAYRFRLAKGFLSEAEEDLKSARWRSCVSNSQSSVENSGKAIIAIFEPIEKSYGFSVSWG